LKLDRLQSFNSGGGSSAVLNFSHTTDTLDCIWATFEDNASGMLEVTMNEIHMAAVTATYKLGKREYKTVTSLGPLNAARVYKLETRYSI